MNYVNIDLDKPRHIRYDYNSVCDFEEKSGKSIQELMSNEGLKLGLASLRSLLWAGLKWEENGLTVPRVGNMIQDFLKEGRSMEELGDAICKAFEVSGLFTKTDEKNLKPEGE